MKRCIHCGAELPEQASFCHSCANSQHANRTVPTPRPVRKRIVLLAGFAAVVLAALITAGTVLWQGGAASGVLPEPQESYAVGSSTPPVPTETPDVAPEPLALSSRTGELLYSDSDGEYRLILSFYRSNGVNPPSEHDETRSEIVGNRVFTYSQLFVTDGTGSAANEEFLAKVRSFEIEAIPQGDSAAMEPVGPVINREDPLALRSAMVYFDTTCGSNIVRWTITMNNGDTLTLQHVLTILEAEQEVTGPILSSYLTEEDYFLRKLTDEQLAALKEADIDTLQAEIATVADAVAYLDQFPHGRDSFFAALDSDFLLDIGVMLGMHRGEATGPDVYTAFTGWCLADDYPESRYIIASGDSHGFTWIYHGLLLPAEGGWHVTTPAAHSVCWNTVYGFDEMTVSSLEGLENALIPLHAGMVDDSNLFLYHLYTIETGQESMNFRLNGDYLATDSGALEHYRRTVE